MKIYTVVGARPNFIKIDPTLPQTIIHTGQHWYYEMSQSFFDDLKLPKPKYNLNCKSNEIGKMVDKLSKIFKKDKPEIVLVFGDTNSSLAGALAATYLNIKVCHIESGLRSFRMDMPEEINRILIDRLATIRICPFAFCLKNLVNEGIKEGIYILGDPSFDAMNPFLPIRKAKKYYKTYNLLTIHRTFNADNPERLRNIFEAIKESGEKFIFPIHPRTKANLAKFNIKIPKNVKKVKPQRYKDMLKLISNAKRVLTDSGGVQREAFWFQVPVLILRNETEWINITGSRAGILVDADKFRILEAMRNFKAMHFAPPIFGTNKKIKEIIYKYI